MSTFEIVVAVAVVVGSLVLGRLVALLAWKHFAPENSNPMDVPIEQPFAVDAVDVDGRALAVGDHVEVVNAGAAQRIGLRARISAFHTAKDLTVWIDLRWNEHPSGGANQWLTPPRFVRRVDANGAEARSSSTARGARS